MTTGRNTNVIHSRNHLRGAPDAINGEWHYVGQTGEPAFVNGWSNTGGAYAVCRFAINDDQLVLEGSVSGGTLGQAVFVLPDSHTPAEDFTTAAALSDGSDIATVIVNNAGSVVINSITAGVASGTFSGTIAATNVTYAGSTDLSASNVEAALDELDSEKVPKTLTLTAGNGLSGGGALSTDRSFAVNVDSSTIEINTDTLRVKADGILVSHIGDAELKALGGVTASADKLAYFTSGTAAAVTDFSAFARTLVDDTTASTARSTLGVVASLFQSGGAQEIALDTLGVPTDISTLNASTSWHGLLRKLDNDTSHFLRGDGAWAAPVGTGGTVAPADVQVFNAGTAQTWTKPAGSPQLVQVICVGAGGGGGGGPSSVSTAKGGGAGGGGGSVLVATLRASDLPGTVTVDVGTGGTGGGGGAAGAGALGSNGSDATGPTTFGSYIKAYGGGGGRAGTNGSVAGGGGASQGNPASSITAGTPSSASNAVGGQAGISSSGGDGINSEWGGAGGAGSATATTRSAGCSLFGGPGGGTGGRVNSSNVGQASAEGGATMSYASAGGGGGTAGTSGASPTDGGSGTFTGPYCGSGGGGGGAGSGVAGKNGGNGSTGAGGGGGGCSSHATSSAAGGNGGNGGDGRCMVITTF